MTKLADRKKKNQSELVPFKYEAKGDSKPELYNDGDQETETADAALSESLELIEEQEQEPVDPLTVIEANLSESLELIEDMRDKGGNLTRSFQDIKRSLDVALGHIDAHRKKTTKANETIKQPVVKVLTMSPQKLQEAIEAQERWAKEEEARILGVEIKQDNKDENPKKKRYA